MAQTTQLLLYPGTSITCPKCEHSFALTEGFARQALESVETASSDAMAQIREEERQRQQREAERVAQEREAAHARALAETRRIEAEGFASQLQALRKQLEESQTLNQAIQQREAQIAAREKSLESRIAEASATKAAELMAGERKALTEQLQDKERQLAESPAPARRRASSSGRPNAPGTGAPSGSRSSRTTCVPAERRSASSSPCLVHYPGTGRTDPSSGFTRASG